MMTSGYFKLLPLLQAINTWRRKLGLQVNVETWIENVIHRGTSAYFPSGDERFQ